MAFEIACFAKNRSTSGGSVPRPPSAIRLSYTSSLTHVTQYWTFHFLTLVTQTTVSGLPFCDIFVPQKLFFRKFLMTSLHVICGVPHPLIQKSWLRLCMQAYPFKVSNLPHYFLTVKPKQYFCVSCVTAVAVSVNVVYLSTLRGGHK